MKGKIFGLGLLAAGLMLALALTGCDTGNGGGGNVEPITISAINVSPEGTDLLSGETRLLAVTRTPAVDTTPVDWTSYPEGAVQFRIGAGTPANTISGLQVTLVAGETPHGTVTVTARLRDLSGANTSQTATFSITAAPDATEISFADVEDATIKLGLYTERTLTLATLPVIASVGNVEWTSYGSAVTIVSYTNRTITIRGAELGVATITATSSLLPDNPASLTVNVWDDPFAARGRVPFTWDFTAGTIQGFPAGIENADESGETGIGHNGLTLHGNARGNGVLWAPAGYELAFNDINNGNLPYPAVGSMIGRVNSRGGRAGNNPIFTIEGIEGPVVVVVYWASTVDAAGRGVDIRIDGNTLASERSVAGPVSLFSTTAIFRGTGPAAISVLHTDNIHFYGILVREPTTEELDPATVHSVTLLGVGEVSLGTEVMITAIVRPYDLDNRNVTWTVNPSAAIVTETDTTVTVTRADAGDVIVTATSVALDGYGNAVASSPHTVNFSVADVWDGGDIDLTFEAGSQFGIAATGMGISQGTTAAAHPEFSVRVGTMNFSFGGTALGTGATGNNWAWQGATGTNNPFGFLTTGGDRTGIIRLPVLPYDARITITYSGTGGTAHTDTRHPAVNGNRNNAPAATNNALENFRTHSWDVPAGTVISIDSVLSIRIHRVQVTEALPSVTVSGPNSVNVGVTSGPFNAAVIGVAGGVNWSVGLMPDGTQANIGNFATWDGANRTLTGVAAGRVYITATSETNPSLHDTVGVDIVDLGGGDTWWEGVNWTLRGGVSAGSGVSDFQGTNNGDFTAAHFLPIGTTSFDWGFGNTWRNGSGQGNPNDIQPGGPGRTITATGLPTGQVAIRVWASHAGGADAIPPVFGGAGYHRISIGGVYANGVVNNATNGGRPATNGYVWLYWENSPGGNLTFTIEWPAVTATPGRIRIAEIAVYTPSP